MKITAKIAVCTLAAALTVPPVPTAASPLAGVDPAVLDPGRSAVFRGSAAEIEAVHRVRLSSGPQGAALYNPPASGQSVVRTTPEMLAGDEIDPVTFDQCQSAPVTPQNPNWYKNRYNSCARSELNVVNYQIKNGQRIEIGRSIFQRTHISIAQRGENRIRFGVRLVHIRDEDVVNDSMVLAIKIGCLEVDLSPGREGHCETSPGGIAKTIAQLKVENGADPAWFESTLITTKVPVDKYAAERRGFFAVDMMVTAGSDLLMYTPAEVRCDEATYVSGSKCVFYKVTSSLALSVNDPTHGESARFIKDAQTNLGLTYPGLLGKKVPGSLTEHPLHRLYKDYDFENDIAGSRRKVRRACQVQWGVDYTLNAAGEVRQCDEYPFATTYENAARVDDGNQYSYAVRPINALHNETAGQIYGRWLGFDHILDNDPFYVIIQ